MIDKKKIIVIPQPYSWDFIFYLENEEHLMLVQDKLKELKDNRDVYDEFETFIALTSYIVDVLWWISLNAYWTEINLQNIKPYNDIFLWTT